MKKSVIAALIAASVSTAVFAQQPPAAGAPPPPPPAAAGAPAPPPPGGPGPLGLRPGAGQGLQEISTYSGTVTKLIANDDYVYDGFSFLNNGDSVQVKFPPHLGNQITSSVKAGATVSVKGVMNTNPEGAKEIRLVSVTAGGKTITDTASARPATPPAETSVSGTSKVSSLQKDREGRINGLILNNNTILKLPPGAAAQLSTLNSGSEVSYTGMQKPVNTGEVSTANYKIVRARTISINGKEYML